MRTLAASRCRLEPQVGSHASEMFEVLSDPAIYEFEHAPPESEAWLRRRFERLECRTSTDGREQWLNWVIRLPDARLAGYVQATVREDHTALVAYELHSRYWRQGIGTHAMQAMLQELRDAYEVRTCLAVLKAKNYRSEGLLHKLGFTPAPQECVLRYRDEPDEQVYALVFPSAADRPEPRRFDGMDDPPPEGLPT